MKKYEVWAKKWDTDSKAIVDVMIGQFDNYVCARIFKDAYEDHFHTTAEIIVYERR